MSRLFEWTDGELIYLKNVFTVDETRIFRCDPETKQEIINYYLLQK